MRKIYLTLVVTIAMISSVFGQGALQGKVIDKASGEPIPFATLRVMKDGNLEGGTTSDFDGKYTIKPLDAGTYQLKVSYLGYAEMTINNVIVKGGQTAFQDVAMQEETEELEAVEIVAETKLIEKDKNTSGSHFSTEDIESMPFRNVNQIARNTPGVTTDAGGGLVIRGSRSNANQTFIDGIKVRGGTNIPRAAIGEIQVITQGVPASIGDLTGGAQLITTRGATTQSFTAIEFLTSGFGTKDGNTQKTIGLDNSAYNLAAVTLGGPIIRKRDENGNKAQAVLSYIFSSEFRSIVDNNPSVVGNYKITDEKMDELTSTPYILPGSVSGSTGQGTILRSDFVREDDMEFVKTRQNVGQRSMNLQANFTINTSETTFLKFGGTYYTSEFRSDVRNTSPGEAYSMYNWENNPRTTATDFRVYGRYTQHFQNDDEEESEENASLLKNAYISIQVDYQKNKRKTQNDSHEDNFFRYGYVGQFVTHDTNSYQFGTVNIDGTPVTGLIHNGFDQLRWDYTPSDLNPVASAYTTQYYDLYKNPDGTPAIEGNYDRQQNVETNTLINGTRPRSVYELWTNPGYVNNSYTLRDNDQFRLSAKGSADIGDHAIQLGFEYEQRIDRGYNLGPVGLWTIGRQLVNAHLQSLDTANPIVSQVGGIAIIDYERAVGDQQSQFDYNVRQALGLDPRGNDFVDFDAYDPDLYKIDFFSANELLSNNLVSYYGYDHTGKKSSGNPSLDDFFNETNDFGEKTRPVPAFQPIYAAAFIEDKFAIEDLIFRVGVRVDRFDANQPVPKDEYSLFPTGSAGEVGDVDHPSNVGDDWIVYTDQLAEVGQSSDEYSITGYRDPSTDKWYDNNGNEVSNPETSLAGAEGVTPLLQDKSRTNTGEHLDANSFEDYEPQVTVMPRISFSFPIHEEASFFANYDILASRPTSGLQFRPTDYLYIADRTNVINNPNLKVERTIAYELGFKQLITESSAITFSAYYRELRDQIQVRKFIGAYPAPYTSFDNIDFGTVTGFTLSYELRRTKNVSLNTNYTLQFAKGTGSSATSALNLVNSNQPNLRYITDLSFDQRHLLNLSFDYRYRSGKAYNGPVMGKGKKQILANSGINVNLRAGSGRPYTKYSNITSQILFSGGQAGQVQGGINGSRLPWQFTVDTRINKIFDLKLGSKAKKQKPANLEVYFQILNLLNSKNINGVYPSTGNPDDDGYLANAASQPIIDSQNDPDSFRDQYTKKLETGYNYLTQRRVRLGLVLSF